MAPLTSDSSLSRGRLDWRSRKWQLRRRKVKFCLFAEALSLPPACSIKRAPISAAYLVISPPSLSPSLVLCPYSSLLHSLLICPLLLRLSFSIISRSPSSTEFRLCKVGAARPLPLPLSVVVGESLRQTPCAMPCRVHSNSNCARDAGDASPPTAEWNSATRHIAPKYPTRTVVHRSIDSVLCGDILARLEGEPPSSTW